jgi:hypothetical protein
MRRHCRLHHHRAHLRVDPRRQVQRCDLFDLPAQLGRVLVERDRMQVYDAEDALVVVLYAHPILERAQIIAYVQVPGGLHPGKDSSFHGVGSNSLS